jgi:hypothetical protein
MKNSATFAGRVRVWKDGHQWKWCAEDESAPAGSKIADRYLEVLGDVIYLKHGDQEGQYIRDAVKAEPPS